MPSKLYGKWKLVKNENFDEYMKQIGVNLPTRKVGLLVSSTSEIEDKGDNKVRLATISTFKSADIVFPLGQEVDEVTMDGRKCKTVVRWDGDNKILETQTWDDGKREAKLEWIYEDEKMILRMESDGVVCKRIHERSA